MNDMAEPLKKCFEAYGVTTYPQMIGSVVETLTPTTSQQRHPVV